MAELSVSRLQRDLNSPIFDEGLKVRGETHADRQDGRIFLQHFGQNLKVCLAVLVRKLTCGQLHLGDKGAIKRQLKSFDFYSCFILQNVIRCFNMKKIVCLLINKLLMVIM